MATATNDIDRLTSPEPVTLASPPAETDTGIEFLLDVAAEGKDEHFGRPSSLSLALVHRGLYDSLRTAETAEGGHDTLEEAVAG